MLVDALKAPPVLAEVSLSKARRKQIETNLRRDKRGRSIRRADLMETINPAKARALPAKPLDSLAALKDFASNLTRRNNNFSQVQISESRVGVQRHKKTTKRAPRVHFKTCDIAEFKTVRLGVCDLNWHPLVKPNGCGKDICRFCGRKGSPAHERRWARIWNRASGALYATLVVTTLQKSEVAALDKICAQGAKSGDFDKLHGIERRLMTGFEKRLKAIFGEPCIIVMRDLKGEKSPAIRPHYQFAIIHADFRFYDKSEICLMKRAWDDTVEEVLGTRVDGRVVKKRCAICYGRHRSLNLANHNATIDKKTGELNLSSLFNLFQYMAKATLTELKTKQDWRWARYAEAKRAWRMQQTFGSADDWARVNGGRDFASAGVLNALYRKTPACPIDEARGRVGEVVFERGVSAAFNLLSSAEIGFKPAKELPAGWLTRARFCIECECLKLKYGRDLRVSEKCRECRVDWLACTHYNASECVDFVAPKCLCVDGRAWLPIGAPSVEGERRRSKVDEVARWEPVSAADREIRYWLECAVFFEYQAKLKRKRERAPMLAVRRVARTRRRAYDEWLKHARAVERGDWSVSADAERAWRRLGERGVGLARLGAPLMSSRRERRVFYD